MFVRAFALLFVLSGPALAATPAKPVQEAWDRSAPRAGNAWVRSNPVPGRPAAGYLTIIGGGQPDKLIGATSPGLRIELHSMTMDGGVMKMAKLEGLAVPAAAPVAFAPGGNHLMIFGLATATKAVPLTLVFGSGAKVTTTAEVRTAGAAAPPNPQAAHGAH
jgi:copper(I)-binding protein